MVVEKTLKVAAEEESEESLRDLIFHTSALNEEDVAQWRSLGFDFGGAEALDELSEGSSPRSGYEALNSDQKEAVWALGFTKDEWDAGIESGLLKPKGQTVYDLAMEMAGDSGSGDSTLKLYLASFIHKRLFWANKHHSRMVFLLDLYNVKTKSPLSGYEKNASFFFLEGGQLALGQNPEDSWLMKLPNLGMLLVSTDGKQLELADVVPTIRRSKKSVSAEMPLLDEKGYQTFLEQYADLPHEGISLVVAKAFVEVNDEATEFYKKMIKEEYQTKKGEKNVCDYKKFFLNGGFYNTPSDLGRVFLKCCMLAQDAKDTAATLRANYRGTEATDFEELSNRLQAWSALSSRLHGFAIVSWVS